MPNFSEMKNICSLNNSGLLLSNDMMRDLNVDQIKKLWILDLIVQSGSLKKAALQAKVSPSAISQSLSSLENAIGKPLIIREKGTMTPTVEALSILDTVRPAFDAFEKLRNIGQAQVPKLSWLNFGTYESIAVDIVPGLVEILKQKMPNLRLGLRVSRTPVLMNMVRKGELCSALVTETDNMDRFSIKRVGEDKLGLFVSSKHPIRQLGWKAIEKVGIGTLSPGKDGLPRYFSKFMKQIKSAQALVLSDSFEVLRTAAIAGSVVAVLPHQVARRTDELIEITPPNGKSLQEVGKHGIFVVSQANCDPEEAEFLAAEIEKLMRIRGN